MSKCDEKNVFGLREYSRQDLFVDATDEVRETDRFYIMIEADEVISELKEENSEIKKQTDIAWGKVNAMYDEITALKADKERLEKELNKCQDIAQQCFKREVKSRERIDELDAKNQSSKQELRSTNRALWLARAERANEIHFMWCQFIYDRKYGIVKFNVKKEWGKNVKQGQTLHTPQEWADVWEEVERKCLEKAEEYKRANFG